MATNTKGETMNDNWQPPPWLLCHYIAMDADGTWCGFLAEPSIDGHHWEADLGDRIHLSNDFVDFDPPPCDDWTTSSRRLRAVT